jgi:hypothetical protein
MWTIPDWYGWHNENSCLASYYNQNMGGLNRNFDIMFFPLHFWKHFGWDYFELGANNKRFWIGFGLISIYWDFPYYDTTRLG